MLHAHVEHSLPASHHGINLSHLKTVHSRLFTPTIPDCQPTPSVPFMLTMCHTWQDYPSIRSAKLSELWRLWNWKWGPGEHADWRLLERRTAEIDDGQTKVAYAKLV